MTAETAETASAIAANSTLRGRGPGSAGGCAAELAAAGLLRDTLPLAPGGFVLIPRSVRSRDRAAAGRGDLSWVPTTCGDRRRRMTNPSPPDEPAERPGVNLGKDPDPSAEAPFDPYRFGRPEHPIPAEYAPPGSTGPTTPAATPYGQDPYGRPSENPFGNPPGTPYGPPPSQYPPYGYSGPPQPPQYSAYGPPTQHRSGKAVAGLVLGICAIVFCWLTVLDGVFVVLGFVFSLIALGETRRLNLPGRGMALAGL